VAAAVPVYLSFPPDLDVDQLERALGDRADAVELIAGPLYLESQETRTRKRAGTFEADGDDDGDHDGEPALTPEHLDAYRRAQVILALDLPSRLAALSPDLRWVQAIGAGVGHLAGAGLDERGIVLTSAQGVGAPPIAEFVIGRLLELYKRFRDLDRLQREHRWQFVPGEVMAGKTLLVVGLGAIGREVAVRARAFGLGTIGVRRSYRHGATSPDVDRLCGPDQLDEVLPEADIVVVAAPETSETRGLFDARRLARMRPGAVLCNVARGSLIDQPALLEALAGGRLRAAILDVVEPEPLPPDSPLWDAEGVVLSPHSSTSMEGYNERLVDLFAANLRRWLDGEPLVNVVDPALLR
jgi:phosphoglycerate dehydrogenase-like enzyme